MANASISDFLSPEGAVLTDPAQVELALARIWASGAVGASGQERAEPVTRICAGNLIVAGRASAWGVLSEVLGGISPEHPTRTIVLLIEDDGGRTQEQSAGVRASVSALCHIPQPGRPQVCCEQIVLRGGTAGLDDVDRTMLPLLEPDLPVALWWTLDPAIAQPVFPRLCCLADRVIIDAGWSGFGLVGQRQTRGAAWRELGWYRARRWRELLASVFDGCEADLCHHIDRFTLTVGDESPDTLIVAAWLIAFAGGQLEWRAVRQLGDGAFELASPRGPLQARLQRGRGTSGGLSCARIDAGQSYFQIGRCTAGHDAFRLIACDQRVCAMPRTVQVPDMRRSSALCAALAAPPVEPAFERAWSLAKWLAERLGSREGSLPPGA